MEVKGFVKILFELAGKEGFTEYEAYYSNSESLKVNIYEGTIENYSVSGSMGLGFRGLYNGRMGYSFTEILDEESAQLLVKSARDNAKIIDSRDTENIFPGSKSYSKVETYDSGLSKVGADEWINLAFNMEKAAAGRDKRVKSLKSCSIGYYNSEISICNSRGLDLSHKDNLASAVIIPVVNDGEGMNSGVGYRITRNFNSLDPESIADEAIKDAVAYLGAKPVSSGKYNILLKNEAACDLLETYSLVFNAERAQKGLSKLKGQAGSVIASKVLTIIDDPLMEDGMSSAPFDAEGVAAKRKEVVSEGVFNTLLYNLKTAAKDGVETTGNASRSSYSSPVDISPFNFYIKPGVSSSEELLKELGEGLYITDLQGLHSGTNTVSGDFSLSVKGFLVSGGKLDRPVEQITLAGNFYSLLKSITAAGSDLKFGMPGGGCFGSPSLLIEGLSVAGS